MSQSLFSSAWYRVAAVRPRLRSHAQIHRHVYRGDVWYVLQNHSSGKFHRFTPVANLVIGLMDGRRTLQEIWDLACVRLGDEVPSQDETIKLMSDLHRADVLQSDAPPDIHELHQRRRHHARSKWKQYIGNPLSLRFPLLDPDRFLAWLAPWVKPVFGWFGAVLWCAMVGWALVLVAMHWSELSADVTDRVFSAENLLLLWIVFPVTKALHEFGHGLATRVEGGEVHEMGVMLLVMMPVPYVDASSASAFRGKKGRMLVGAAGMLAELFIAALATFAWVYLEPGVERALAYNVMLVAGVSTLLFNINPLLRYDGYYILADWLEMPNLAQRANEYMGYLVNRHAFGLDGQTSPAVAPGERGWFVFYATGSFFYRMFMMLSIVLLVASKFFFIGVVLAIWAFANMLLMPIGKKLQNLVAGPKLASRRRRALLVTGGSVALLAALILWLPAPSVTRAEGVIWAPEQAQVRATVDGFLARVVAQPEQRVKKGDVLFECDDPELAARTRLLQAQLAEIDARYTALVVSKRVQAEIANEQRVHIAEALQLAHRRQADLVVRSPADGTFVIEHAQSFIGRYVPRGEVMAYVIDDRAGLVRVAVPQADGDRVRDRTRKVEVRFVSAVAEPIEAHILREVPAATNEVPSLTLSLQGGGKIGLDPGKGGGDARAIDKLFLFDLGMARAAPANFLGGRMYVRFEHEPEPIGYQWYREIRRAVLKRFQT